MTANRDLALHERKVDTRPSCTVEVFDIDRIAAHFQESLALIQEQSSHISSIASQNQIVADDMLRAQVVFIESAFDYYLHEIIKLGIVEMYHGEWIVDKTEKYTNLSLAMSDVETALQERDTDHWLKNWISQKYATKTLLSFSEFKNVCNLLGISMQKISDVFYQRGSDIKPQVKLENFINYLYRHRNRIAHQSDRRRDNAERQPIKKEMVADYLQTIQRIVDAINAQIRKSLPASKNK